VKKTSGIQVVFARLVYDSDQMVSFRAVIVHDTVEFPDLKRGFVTGI